MHLLLPPSKMSLLHRNPATGVPQGNPDVMLRQPFLRTCKPGHIIATQRVHEQFEEIAAKEPDLPCVTTDKEEYTYGQVFDHEAEDH
jgi:non-ribosomal peptide synthetase component F